VLVLEDTGAPRSFDLLPGPVGRVGGIEVGNVNLLGQADAVALVGAAPGQLRRQLEMGPAGVAARLDELGRRVEVAAGGDGDELFELPGDDAGVDVVFLATVALGVEAGEQG